MSGVLLNAQVAAAFGVKREAEVLPGTEGRTYRAGNIVLRSGVEKTALLWKIDVLR